MSDDLDKFINENTKFLKLEDGESWKGTYLGSKVIPNKFDTEKKTVEYQLGTKEGYGLTWTNGSIRVARAFKEITETDTVSIKRIGIGQNTTYEVIKDESGVPF